MNGSFLYKILGLALLVNITATGLLKAQTPTNCLEIESVLADACGTPEGENEMVRFKIGPAPVNISNLNVSWPNGTFLGISPVNATTNGIVSALNSTIVSCGYLIQPSGGVLPAGKTVLLVTSTNISLSANSFANLTDTLYVIFQNAGNTAGHFVNYSSTPGLRTLVISRIAPACSDAVTYDRSLLVNQAGGHGGSSALNDGATIEFSWPGVPNYINNGCMAPISTITSNAGSTASTCAGGTVSLSGTASGNYTSVIWEGGQGSFSSPANLNSNYTAAATESGTVVLSLGVIGHCNDTVFSTVSITISPLPNAAITASGSTAICPGDSVTLTASGAGTYSWSTGSTASSITVFSAGTYTLTVTNSCGSQTATQTVTASSAPAVTINASSTSFCAGSNLLLYATGSGNYSWTGGSVNDSIFVTTGGTYNVTASASCGTATDNITVNVLPLPTAAIAASGTTSLCPGNSVTFTGSGGTSYAWLPSGPTGSSFTTSVAATYTLAATNACGTDTASVSVTALSNPNAAISPAGSSICAGGNLTLNATGGSSFVWSGGQTGSSITATTEGIYWVTASNACGSDSASVFVNVDSVTAFFTASTLSGTAPLPVDFISNSSASAIALSWDLGNGSGAAGTSASAVYQSPGTYTVTLTATNVAGCSDTYMLTVIVPEGASALQMPNVFTPNGDGINDQFSGIGYGIKEFNCKVYDRWGILVTELPTFKSNWDGRTTAGVMATDGTYFYFMEATGADGKTYREKGFVELMNQ